MTATAPDLSTPTRLSVLLVAHTSIAHGSAAPNAAGSSNVTLFNRELVRLEQSVPEARPEEVRAALERVLATYTLTAPVVDFLAYLDGPALVGALFVAQIPALYGAGDGEGLFAGQSRYSYLTSRLSDGAAQALSLSGLWSYLIRKLALSPPPESSYERSRAFLMLPRAAQSKALAVCLRRPEEVVMAARFIASARKDTSASYAAKAKRELREAVSYTPTPEQIAELSSSATEARTVALPTLSGNAIRHCLLREPAALRMLAALDLDPHSRAVPKGVELFLFGGGNTAKGAKVPGAADLLEAKVRDSYPMVDAFGGAVDHFLFSRSAVSIATWIICRENNDVTRLLAGIETDESIFDMLEETTRTRAGRGGKGADDGQMIFSYETLARGVEAVARLSFQPFTPSLTLGCVAQALLDSTDGDVFFGASSARGHGHLRVVLDDGQRVELERLAARYRDYLSVNRERLAAGLLDGTFGTEVVLCAAR